MVLSPDGIYFVAFLVIAALVFHYVKSYDAKLWVIVLANAVFYVSIDPGYFVLHALMVLAAYGLALGKNKWKARLKYPVLAATILLLIPLLFFKTGLAELVFRRSLQEVTTSWTGVVQWIPVGLSFYTFTLIGYVTDVYKGYTPAEKNYFRLLAFAGFFPALLAGPIERSRTLLRQLNGPFTEPASKDFQYALLWIVWGMFKKSVIANTIAAHINPVFLAPDNFGSGTLYVSALLFVVQIFMDFSAYSDIAIGAALFFGIRLTPNFHPLLLASTSRSVFWRRWHISLTNWFRDYVYFPLASGRRKAWQHYLITYTVFFLTGIWHGISFAFILWGMINATSMIVEQAVVKWRRKRFATLEKQQAVQWLYAAGGLLITMHVSALAGLLFRTETLPRFYAYVQAMKQATGDLVWDKRALALLGIAALMYVLVVKKIDTSQAAWYEWKIAEKWLPYLLFFLICFTLFFRNEEIKNFYYYRF